MSIQQTNIANKSSASSGSIHRANTVDISKFNYAEPRDYLMVSVSMIKIKMEHF